VFGKTFFGKEVKTVEKETAVEPKPEHTENTHCEKAILEPQEIR
jgi:hypothetical protein